MAIQKNPGRTEPFVSQKSPKGKGGPGMGIGALIFLIALIGGFIVSLTLIRQLLDDVVFPDIGITPMQIAIGFMSIIVIGSIYLIAKGDMFHEGMGSRYKDLDPSLCRRVVKDGYDGIEFIITGNKQDTFAKACRANWRFESVDQKSNWYIKDEKGNDVTNQSLETADGIFFLVPEFGSEIQKLESDESDEYSSIHDSVEYYD